MNARMKPTMTNQERLVLFCLQAWGGQTFEDLARRLESKAPHYLRRTIEIMVLRGQIYLETLDNANLYYSTAHRDEKAVLPDGYFVEHSTGVLIKDL